MNVNELQAGRELDALVAERVMGCKPKKRHDDWVCTCDQDDHAIQSDNHEVPYLLYYSTNIEAAWEVVKCLAFMRDHGIYKPIIRLEFFEHDGPYECRIGRCKSIDNEDDIVGVAEERCSGEDRAEDEMTVAMCVSICRAALKAVGVDKL